MSIYYHLKKKTSGLRKDKEEKSKESTRGPSGPFASTHLFSLPFCYSFLCSLCSSLLFLLCQPKRTTLPDSWTKLKQKKNNKVAFFSSFLFFFSALFYKISDFPRMLKGTPHSFCSPFTKPRSPPKNYFPFPHFPLSATSPFCVKTASLLSTKEKAQCTQVMYETVGPFALLCFFEAFSSKWAVCQFIFNAEVVCCMRLCVSWGCHGLELSVGEKDHMLTSRLA